MRVRHVAWIVISSYILYNYTFYLHLHVDNDIGDEKKLSDNNIGDEKKLLISKTENKKGENKYIFVTWICFWSTKNWWLNTFKNFNLKG